MFRPAPTLLALALLTAGAAQAQTTRYVPAAQDDWATNARFFMGFRGGVAIPPGGTGVAPTVALELGVSAPKGLGFGLHLLGMANPPAIRQLNIPKADYGLGALADVRMYFQSVDPLTLYATLSGGFVAGPGTDTNTNVVLPLLNPGFGARVKVADTAYVAFEFGMAGFFIPFITLSAGWEPERRQRAVPLAGSEDVYTRPMPERERGTREAPRREPRRAEPAPQSSPRDGGDATTPAPLPDET